MPVSSLENLLFGNYISINRISVTYIKSRGKWIKKLNEADISSQFDLNADYFDFSYLIQAKIQRVTSDALF